MTDDLHDVLDQTADLAGPAHFDADALWRQGARTQRVHNAMTVVGVLAVLALVSLSVWWGTGTSTPRPAAPATTHVTPALPSTLYDPPTDLAMSSDLRTGPLAAIFIPELRDGITAVSALDGSYHGLDIPGYIGRIASMQGLSPALALSPAGQRLAYVWQVGRGLSPEGNAPGGVRLVDLRSGAVTTYRVHGANAPTCGGLAWSANGRFLASTCFDHAIDAGGGAGFRVLIVRDDTRTGRQITLPGVGTGELVAVGDNGLVAIPDNNRVVLAPHDGPVFGPSVRWAVRGSPESVGWLTDQQGLVMIGPEFPARDQIRLLLQYSTGDQPAPPIRVNAVSARLAGAVGAGSVAIWTVQSTGGQLSTFSPDEGLTSRVSFEGLAPEEVSFATALLQGPTRDTPDPNHNSTRDHVRTAMPYLAVGVVLLTGLLVIVLLRRKERTLRQA